MVRLFFQSFPEHEVYLCCRDDTRLLPFADLPNLRVFRGSLKAASKDKSFDACVYIGGSTFIIHSWKLALVRVLTAPRPQVDKEALARDAYGHIEELKALFSQWEARHKR